MQPPFSQLHAFDMLSCTPASSTQFPARWGGSALVARHGQRSCYIHALDEVCKQNELSLVLHCVATPFEDFDGPAWHDAKLPAISKVLYDDRTSDVTVVQPNEDAVSISRSMPRKQTS